MSQDICKVRTYVDHADVQVVDEQDDVGSGVGSSDPVVAQSVDQQILVPEPVPLLDAPSGATPDSPRSKGGRSHRGGLGSFAVDDGIPASHHPHGEGSKMLFRRLRRVAVGAGVGLGLIALSTSSAHAFECYNAVRSAAGNQAAGANSQALVSFERILADPEIVGLCPEGVDFTIAAVEDAGYRTDILINFRTLMAGGLERAGHEDQLHDGKGIDHLGEEFFAFVDPIIGEAFGLCG